MLLAIAFPFPLAVIAASRSRAAIAASSLVALIVAIDAGLLYSRSAYLSMGATYAALSTIEWRMLRGLRLISVALIGLLIVTGVAFTSRSMTRSLTQFWTGSVYHYDTATSLTMRFEIWSRTSPMIRNHPWLGVGPGN